MVQNPKVPAEVMH